jgi:hypothetical protein
VGYKREESTTVTNTWSASLSATLGKIGGSASFSHAKAHYSGQSWSSKQGWEVDVDVPPGSQLTFRQRKFKVHIQLESAPEIRVDCNKGPEQVYIRGNHVVFKNPYGGSDCDCDASDLIHASLSFDMQCYTTNPNSKEREQDCKSFK